METLQIFRPTLSSRLTQDFGENRACLRPNGSIYGVSKECPQGTSFYHSVGMLGHNGIDIGGMNRTPIYHGASFSGYMKTEKDFAGGIGVDVISYLPLYFEGTPPDGLPCDKTEDGFYSYVKMRYWHLDEVVGYDGKDIKMGDPIGLMGNTGASSGVHLHFAPKWCDKEGNSTFKNNGYYGAFNPNPYYYHKIFVKDHIQYMNEKKVDESALLKQLSLLEKALLLLRELIHKL